MSDITRADLAAQAAQKAVLLKNVTYDIAKDVTTIYLPAATALYVGLAPIWHLPLVSEISQSVPIIITFLGVVLKISSNQNQKAATLAVAAQQAGTNYDGTLVVNTSDPNKDTVRLVPGVNLQDIVSGKIDKDSYLLKIVQEDDTVTPASQ
jgi:hypothetical protein